MLDNGLPGKMSGKDLVVQEQYESTCEKKMFDTMDRVDRRDRQGHIVSFTSTPKYRSGYDLIDWSKREKTE